jgi:hypothetical protein
MKKTIILTLTVLTIIAVALTLTRRLWQPLVIKHPKRKTVQSVIRAIGPSIDTKLRPLFARKNVPYPPKKLVLLVNKTRKVLGLWAFDGKSYILIKTYKILAASGKPGPKLRRNDRQVPEGIYKIIGLNPNSRFRLSLKLNYPNSFDKRMAKRDKRKDPGDNIFIHGNRVSTGCIAIGDRAIEELFILIARTGKSRVTVIILPNGDIKKKNLKSPRWIDLLYNNIKEEINRKGIQPL